MKYSQHIFECLGMMLAGHFCGQLGITAFKNMKTFSTGWWERHIISKYPFDDEM
jgi:hypothetical protein